MEKGLHVIHLAMADNNITSKVSREAKSQSMLSAIHIKESMLARHQPLTPFASFPNTLPTVSELRISHISLT